MLSEKEIEALKNGAYGVTRSGRKARYIGENENGSPIIALFYEDGTFNSTHIYATSLVFSEGIETHFDIVGLWKNKPEPFDLERALAGEPLIDLHNNEKLWLYKSHKDGSLITEYENTDDRLESTKPLEYCNVDLMFE